MTGHRLALGLGRAQNDLVASRGSEDDSPDRRHAWADVDRHLVRAEPALDAVGIAAHAYFRDADLAGGMDGGGAAGEPRSWRPLDEERQRGLGGRPSANRVLT